MGPLSKKQIIIIVIVAVILVIIGIFAIVSMVWLMSSKEESSFDDLLEAANSRL